MLVSLYGINFYGRTHEKNLDAPDILSGAY